MAEEVKPEVTGAGTTAPPQPAPAAPAPEAVQATVQAVDLESSVRPTVPPGEVSISDALELIAQQSELLSQDIDALFRVIAPFMRRGEPASVEGIGSVAYRPRSAMAEDLLTEHDRILNLREKLMQCAARIDVPQ